MTLEQLIEAAYKEDMPQGDVTTDSLRLEKRLGRAKLVAKQDLVFSGREAFEKSLLRLEPEAKLRWHFNDGAEVLKGQIICTLHGDLLQILKAERTALNFAMQLSGIATLTRSFVKKTAGTKTKIIDTRKILPGYRQLIKQAVVHGGGTNHRMDLSSAILIKDNHIAVMGGITAAVKETLKNSDLPIEVEAGTLDDVRECVKLGPTHRIQCILLDNMTTEQMREALTLIPPEIHTEASGNMNLNRIAEVSALGVDFISVGALTHSAPSADLSLQFFWEQE
jgi:nicotinate-nucleotide pyrophosphorylase (carboxylating)